jgi:hypothetical protein
MTLLGLVAAPDASVLTALARPDSSTVRMTLDLGLLLSEIERKLDLPTRLSGEDVRGTFN